MPSAWVGPVLERIRAWAADDESVRAVMIVGSQARTEQPADAWSDLDVVVFHNRPTELIGSTAWVERFGEVVLTFVEPTAVLGSKERRVLYSNGKDVDFAVFPSDAARLIIGAPEGLRVLQRGYRIVLDKDGVFRELAEQLPRPVPVQATLPRPEEFQELVADFWYHVQWTAKKLRRGELWTAKMASDGYLKTLLYRMIEWRRLLDAAAGVDVWHRGRFLDAWAPPEILHRLPGTFSRYEAADVARGLEATYRLFGEISREIADARGWAYPGPAEAFVCRLTATTLADDPRTE